MDEFWKKRDPDPSTEFNEFKEEYFRRLEIENKAVEERVWSTKKDFFLALTEAELEEMGGESYSVEIPLSFPEGQYAMTVLLENSTGEEAVRRYMTFKI